MATLITVIIMVVCLLLALIILIQNPKGGGLAAEYGSAQQLGGVQKTTDFLEKATWTLGIALLVLSLVSSIFYSSETGIQTEDPYMDDMPVMEQPLPASTDDAATADPMGDAQEEPQSETPEN
ncbi:MAG: preprotein translocase subunit SecG [Sphingobacteriales bacterium]|jgi:preprotein translocase subunit SecG